MGICYIATPVVLLCIVLVNHKARGKGVYVDRVMLGVNNGPNPYRADLGQGNMLTGGISPAGYGYSSTANTSVISSIYKSMNVPGIRPNDDGGPFDLRCMFPIQNISDIPSTNSTFEEIRDDPRWNWEASDKVFSSMLEHGFAPYLKLASREWVSGLQEGLSYVDGDMSPEYVIEPKSLKDFCTNWPYISPIIESIGDKLVLTIVERYNNETLWNNVFMRNTNGTTLSGPPLEWETWSKITNATVGIELQNEYNILKCLKTGEGERMSLRGWKENCGGAPYTWNGKYWDGTPEGAHRSYASQALAIKRRFPGIKVGGPAIGTGSMAGLSPSGNENMLPAGGAAVEWVRSFLQTVKRTRDESGFDILDWFSWHSYTSCASGDGIDCSTENPNSMRGIAARMRAILDSEGFGDVPMIVSEHNANFAINGGNTYPGTVAGAAITAANIAGLILSQNELNIIGAYIVNGIDGPFIPYNMNSFPLTCTAEYTVPSSWKNKPSDIVFTGRYVNDCMYGGGNGGAMSINLANGMGAVYSNGDKKPTALVYEDVISAFLEEESFPLPFDVPSSIVGMYARNDSTTTCGKLLLVNADPSNYSPTLPSLANMSRAILSPLLNTFTTYGIDESRVRVLQIVQHIRGSYPGIHLPNNISSFGTLQVVGESVSSTWTEIFEESTPKTNSNTRILVSSDGHLQLPPSCVVVFSDICYSS